MVGLVADGDVLRGVEVRRFLGRTRAVRAGEVDLAPGALDEGRIVDADSFTEGLRALWKSARFRSKHVAWGIDGREATFRRLTLPDAVGDDIETAAAYELDDYLPYELEDAVVAVRELDRLDDEIVAVAVALRRDTAESIAAMVRDAGLRLATINLAPTALGAAVQLDELDERDAIVGVDAASTTILLRHHGRPTMARVLSAGGGERNAQMADEIAQALASVDHYRGRGDDASVQEDPRQRRFRTVAEEIAAAIRYEEGETGERHTSVLLGGSFGDEPELHELVRERFDIDIVGVPTPSWWKVDGSFAPWTSASAVANCALGRDVAGAYDLEPPTVVQRRVRRREAAIGVTAGLLLAAPALQLVESARTSADAALDDAVAAEHHADIVAARVDALDDVASLVDDVDYAQRLVDDAVAAELHWPRLLETIAGSIPEDTFLSGVSLRIPEPDNPEQDAAASFSGIALDQDGVGRWLLAVEAVEGIEDVWLVQSTSSVFGSDELPVVSFLADARLSDSLRSPRALEGESS